MSGACRGIGCLPNALQKHRRLSDNGVVVLTSIICVFLGMVVAGVCSSVDGDEDADVDNGVRAVLYLSGPVRLMSVVRLSAVFPSHAVSFPILSLFPSHF